MPLSEHEERILKEIERQLAAEDPRFVARARRQRGTGGWSRSTRMRIAIGLGVLGVLSVLGLIFDIVFGAVGLVLIFVAIVIGATAVKDRSEPQQAVVPPDERT